MIPKYIMLITYSWDSDYVAIPCETETEAKNWLQQYLQEEILTITNESEYEPVVHRYCDTEVELIYEEAEEYVNSTTCIATYKVIEIGHGFNNPEFKYTK